jgi:hypothetical protein
MAGGAQAAALVQISLWDKGADVQMPMGLAYATPGLDVAKATMGIKTSPGAVKAGEVTFKVTNDSKDTVHEMIVMYLADPGKPLPYLEAENRVDEDKSGDKGVDGNVTQRSFELQEHAKNFAAGTTPRAFAAGSLPSSITSSASSPVAMRMTRTALPITSAGRFWPSGPVGNVVALHGTLKIIQFGQSAVAGIDVEFDIPRFEFARLVYGLPAGQVIDHQDVRLLTEFYGIAHCPCSYAFR